MTNEELIEMAKETNAVVVEECSYRFADDCPYDCKNNYCESKELVGFKFRPDELAKFADLVSANAITSMQTEQPSRAIEHGEYLAKSAERFLEYLNSVSDVDEGVINPDDEFGDFAGNLRSSIYEFRKRAEKFKANPAPTVTPNMKVD